MKLEFKYDKLTIKNMKKLLYDDFTAFAASPRGRTSSQSSHIAKKRFSSQENNHPKKGYKPFYHNKRPVISQGGNNQNLRLKLKANLNSQRAGQTGGSPNTSIPFLNRDTDTKGLLYKLETLMK